MDELWQGRDRLGGWVGLNGMTQGSGVGGLVGGLGEGEDVMEDGTAARDLVCVCMVFNIVSTRMCVIIKNEPL